MEEHLTVEESLELLVDRVEDVATAVSNAGATNKHLVTRLADLVEKSNDANTRALQAIAEALQEIARLKGPDAKRAKITEWKLRLY